MRKQASEVRRAEEQGSTLQAQAEQLQHDLAAAVQEAALYRRKVSPATPMLSITPAS